VAVTIINQQEVVKLLPMRECIEVMEQAFLSLARNTVIQPLRMVMASPGNKFLAMMPAFIADGGVLGAKILTVFPGNHNTAFDAHQGVVLLFEADHGSLRAIIDASAITGIRTAAVSAVATRALANPDSSSLALLGAGTQAKAHLEAIRLLFPLRQVLVWSIFPEEARQFAADQSRLTGLAIHPAATAEEAVVGSDIICTVSPAREPILMGSWLKPGAHVNAIGACTAVTRELDTAAVLHSKLFIDRMESAQKEAGDFIIAKQEGAIDDSHIRGELGDVLAGTAKGRESELDITLFKAVGLAMQDMAAARYILDKASKYGAGLEVVIGGRPSGNQS
jgi:ornithine cyclodeaminase